MHWFLLALFSIFTEMPICLLLRETDLQSVKLQNAVVLTPIVVFCFSTVMMLVTLFL